MRKHKLEAVNLLLSCFVTALLIVSSFFTNQAQSCQDKKFGEAIKQLHFSSIAASMVGSAVVMERLGAGMKEFSEFAAGNASETQKSFLNAINTQICDSKEMNVLYTNIAAYFFATLATLTALMIFRKTK